MTKTWNDIKPGDTLTVHRCYRKRAFKLVLVEIHMFSTDSKYATVTGERLRMDGTPSRIASGARKALPKGQRYELVHLDDVKAIEPAAPKPVTTTGDWTIAYRTPRANAFHRVTNWSGTWHQAVELAGIFAKANPDMEVFYTTSRELEIRQAAEIHAGTLAGHYAEDHGNIMIDSGRRIRIRDNREVPAEMLAQVRDAEAAKAHWEDSYNAQPWVKLLSAQVA